MTATGVTFHEICSEDELWDGEMDVFEAGDVEVLVLKHEGQFHAYQAICPHQDIPLVEGKFEKGVLTCRAHLWQFAADSGRGINPSNCRLKRYPVEIDAGKVRVGEQPIEE
ncbi:Rieske 2Fe-2S domain-containing protein [Sphingopyxis sp. OPL5]|uniref:Rieske 2Fe-2S domain-containing protein n=1 Tax=Sphingopyxis sp. OPL5 TaxID=2486273 RepID=UPI00223C0FD0|nr:Rieske 2Fe-2S domain-containing protein [Sphingopyxis sp. OPL5]